MKRLVGVAIIGFWLAGCVAGPQSTAGKDDSRQREQDMAAARQACGQRYGTRWTARARCVNEAEDRVLKAGSPHPDLYARRQALRIQLAERQERNELTEDEARREFMQADAQIQREAAARQAGARVATRQP
jgi:hypothetical protein